MTPDEAGETGDGPSTRETTGGRPRPLVVALPQLTQREFAHLSHAELETAFRELTTGGSAASADVIKRTLHELELQRMELEMQNRALRQAQHELEITLRKYSDLYDYSPLGYLTLTPNGRIQQVNLAAATMLGTNRHALSGLPLAGLIDPMSAERFAGFLQHCAGSQVPMAFTTVLRRTGADVQFSACLAPASATEAPAIWMVVTDVTDLRKTQRQLELANRELDSFCYSVSHDLRTPLLTIGSYSGLIAAEHAGGLDRDGVDYLRRIRDAAGRMDLLLRNILEYGRLARADFVLGPVNLDEVMDDILEQYSDRIGQTNAKVQVRRPLSPVRGSRSHLTRLVGSLMDNALKFTRRGVPPDVEIWTDEEQDGVTLVVADDGIGVPTEYAERIFGLFERLHGVSSPYPGNGIGLALARRFAERLGGRIWVASSGGPGSRFHVRLLKP